MNGIGRLGTMKRCSSFGHEEVDEKQKYIRETALSKVGDVDDVRIVEDISGGRI